MYDINILIKNGININKCLVLFGDISLYNDTMRDFLNNIDVRMNSLSKCLQRGDLVGYIVDIHALKSGAKYLGFKDLADLTLRLENYCTSNDLERIKKEHPILLQEVSRYVSISRDYFASSETNTIKKEQVDKNVIKETITQEKINNPANNINMYIKPEVNLQTLKNKTDQIEKNILGLKDHNNKTVETPQVKDIPIKTEEEENMPVYENRPISVVPNQSNKTDQKSILNGENKPIIKPKLRKDKIFVVDDSVLIVNFITRVLSADYEIITVGTGEEAIKLLSNQTFRDDIKLCLLDLNMPNIDGYQVLEYCKNNNFFKDIPFIVESGVEDTSSLDRLNAYPVEGILLKPFKESDLKRFVEKSYATYFNN